MESLLGEFVEGNYPSLPRGRDVLLGILIDVIADAGMVPQSVLE